MLVQLFRRGTGGGAGPVHYCCRSESPLDGKPRTPAPEVLKGNPAMTQKLIDGPCERLKHRYTSGVLSFAAEDDPSRVQLDRLITDFESIFFAGLAPDQYDILWIRHQHAGRQELHFIVPRIELHTGKSLNITPPGYQRLSDAWRDAWNFRMGWADPSASNRKRAAKEVDYSAKASAARLRAGLANAPEPRTAIHEFLIGQIAAGAVLDRESLLAALHDAGLETPRAGSNYVTARDPVSGQRWRLKGGIYEQRFDGRVTHAIEPKDETRAAGGIEDGKRRAQRARARCNKLAKARAAYNRKRYSPPRSMDEAEVVTAGADIGGDSAGFRGDGRQHTVVLDRTRDRPANGNPARTEPSPRCAEDSRPTSLRTPNSPRPARAATRPASERQRPTPMHDQHQRVRTADGGRRSAITPTIAPTRAAESAIPNDTATTGYQRWAAAELRRQSGGAWYPDDLIARIDRLEEAEPDSLRICYRDGVRLNDYGSRVEVADGDLEAAARHVIALAQARRWSSVVLSGGPAWERAAVRAALAAGLTVEARDGDQAERINVIAAEYRAENGVSDSALAALILDATSDDALTESPAPAPVPRPSP